MKKYLKLISVILCSVIVSVTLCGCGALDSARKNHGFWQTDESFELDGTVYKMLPQCDEFSPEINNYTSYVSVTESDVPLLLKDFIGEPFYYNDDRTILQGEYLGELRYYCSEDIYDELTTRINEGLELNNLCYSYYEYDIISEDYLSNTYMLTDAQANALIDVYSTVEPYVLPDAATMDYDYLIEIYSCSEDLLFRSYALDICLTADNNYYIATYTEENTILFTVPDKYQSDFDAVFEAQINAESSMEYFYEY